MTYYFKTYNLVKDYAEKNGLILQYGFYSSSEKISDYITDEKKFSLELNKSNYVILLFKNNIFIIICKKHLFKDTNSFNKMDALTKNRQEMLLIYEYELDQKKLHLYLKENKPIVNAISMQLFLNGINHDVLPASIELFDFNSQTNILGIKKNNLPEISFNDPIIAYLRFKPGQIIKIKDYSPVSGYNVSYRYIL